MRCLDLETGVHTTRYQAGRSIFTISAYCSYPDDVCVYDINSSQSLPQIHIALANTLTDSSLANSTCSIGQVQLRGITRAGIGMLYESVAKLAGNNTSRCSNDTLVVQPSGHSRLTIVLAAGTNFDQYKGNIAADYSFRGPDPHEHVQSVVNKASGKSAQQLLDLHVADYTPLSSAFVLNLPDTQKSAGLETADLVARYSVNSSAVGDPYLESLTFDFARHLFISSSRDGSLPPNLQGRWSTELSAAWSADYHANINLQMNHWGVDQTGLGGLQTPLWEYMAQNWAPRGADTARLLYNTTGWVVHNEMNIFGYTAMKNGSIEGEIWAHYPIAAAWMMQHVWDYYDYSQDTLWLKETGYPMLKAIAEFWSSQLQEDSYFNDNTLVVNPCTSAEHGPTTFACTHYQQLIHQVFETTLQSAAMVNEQDQDFIFVLESKLARLDKGLRIGRWSQIQEWKLDIDVQNDTHRHLSHLIGWYPGWSIASYADGYTNETIRQAVETTLYSRGLGIEDANAGWEKIWRSACWARLNDAERAYFELRLTIGENWAPNLLSMYSGKNPPFQIDANLGVLGAVGSMLVADMPVAREVKGNRKVVLGPAIPAAWGNGNVKGLRLRGGGIVDFSWDGEGVVVEANLTGQKTGVEMVNRRGEVLARWNA